VRPLLAATSGDTEAETRAAAIVTVFYCLGLRVSELCGLTFEETDLASGNTWIKGKGRKEKELIPLPAIVVTAIRRYLPFRGTMPGPLFQTRGQRGKHRNGALETRSRAPHRPRALAAGRAPRVVPRLAPYVDHSRSAPIVDTAVSRRC
jgi:site-specific recombinase XerC